MVLKRISVFFWIITLVFTPVAVFSGVMASEWILTEGTQLMQAAEAGDKGKVVALIKKGADISEENEHKATALIYAASKGRVEVVQYLLSKGADANACAKANMCPLWFAATSNTPKRRNSHKIIKLLLEAGADASEVPSISSFESPPILLVVYQNKIETVKLFLKYGASVETEDRRTGRSLLSAAVAGGKKEMVEFLLNRGADPSRTRVKTPAYGMSALEYAKKKGHLEVVQLIQNVLAGERHKKSVSTVDEIIENLYKDDTFDLESVNNVIRFVSKSDLRLIKNTIFAKKNYKFDSEDLLKYYRSKFTNFKPLNKKIKLSGTDKENLKYLKKMKEYIMYRDAAS